MPLWHPQTSSGRRRPLLMAMLLLLGLACSTEAQPKCKAGPVQTSDYLEGQNGAKAREICLFPWQPMVNCTLGARNDTNATGYQVELFRHLVASSPLQWPDGSWYFRCMAYSQVVEDLTSQNGSCFMTAAGLDQRQEYIQRGLAFSWPTYTAGLRILVKQAGYVGGTWAVLQAFHWSVWLALGLTGPCVGLIFWLIESWATYMELQVSDKPSTPLGMRDLPAGHIELASNPLAPASPASASTSTNSGCWSPGGATANAGEAAARAPTHVPACHHCALEVAAETRTHTEQKLRSIDVRQVPFHPGALADSIWYSLGPLVVMAWPSPTVLASRLMLLVWGFLILIILNVFWAASAALITTFTSTPAVRSLQGLHGKAVATWEPYVPELQKYGVFAHGLPWESLEQDQAFLDLLDNGTVAAVVLDRSWVDWVAGHNCSFTAVGPPFHTWSQGFAWPPGANRSIVDAFTQALMTLQQETHLMDQLAADFIQGGNRCVNRLTDTQGPIMFEQFSGLWWLLIGSVVLGGAYLAVYHLYTAWRISRLGLSDDTSGLAQGPA